jgi:hypothetical protein
MTAQLSQFFGGRIGNMNRGHQFIDAELFSSGKLDQWLGQRRRAALEKISESPEDALPTDADEFVTALFAATAVKPVQFSFDDWLTRMARMTIRGMAMRYATANLSRTCQPPPTHAPLRTYAQLQAGGQPKRTRRQQSRHGRTKRPSYSANLAPYRPLVEHGRCLIRSSAWASVSTLRAVRTSPPARPEAARRPAGPHLRDCLV